MPARIGTPPHGPGIGAPRSKGHQGSTNPSHLKKESTKIAMSVSCPLTSTSLRGLPIGSLAQSHLEASLDTAPVNLAYGGSDQNTNRPSYRDIASRGTAQSHGYRTTYDEGATSQIDQ